MKPSRWSKSFSASQTRQMTPNAEPYRGFFVHPADSKHLLPLKFNFAPIIPQRGCIVKRFFARNLIKLGKVRFTLANVRLNPANSPVGQANVRYNPANDRFKGFFAQLACASAKLISTKIIAMRTEVQNLSAKLRLRADLTVNARACLNKLFPSPPLVLYRSGDRKSRKNLRGALKRFGTIWHDFTTPRHFLMEFSRSEDIIASRPREFASVI